MSCERRNRNCWWRWPPSYADAIVCHVDMGCRPNSGALRRPKFFPPIDEAHCRINEYFRIPSALFRGRLARIALTPDAGWSHFSGRRVVARFLRLERLSKKHHSCSAVCGGHQRKHSREVRWNDSCGCVALSRSTNDGKRQSRKSRLLRCDDQTPALWEPPVREQRLSSSQRHH